MSDSDLSAQSKAKHTDSNATSSIVTTRSGSTGFSRTTSATSVLSNPLPPVVTITSSNDRSSPHIAQDPNLDDTPAPRTTNLLTASRISTPPTQTDVLVVPAARQLSKRVDAVAEPVNGSYGLSSIPTSPGGILYVAIAVFLSSLSLCSV